MNVRPKYVKAFIVVSTAIIFLSCAGKTPELSKEQPRYVELRRPEFPVFEWDKNRFLHLDYSAFPDSVTFFLPVIGKPLDMDNSAVIEDVFGWADSCDFHYTAFGSSSDANVVIVEDISASMGDYVVFTDRLIWGYVSTLVECDCEVALIRFGDRPERTIDWVLPDTFLALAPESLGYPNARGSDLSGALIEALDLVAERPSSPATIALFSDGDFGVERLPYHILDRAKRYGVPINVFMHGKSAEGALAEISKRTGGTYLVQPGGGFSPGMVSAVMSESYLVTYYPVHKDEDGALHRISLNASGGRRFSGEYRAPGEVPPLAIEPEPLVLPEELLSTNRIPFRGPGNTDILPEAAMMLDAIAAAVNSLPDTLGLTLSIRGYACNIGPTGLNMKLSKKRAFNVMEYLITRVNGNIDFDVSWFGEMYPLNGNSNEAERQENRRVEIRLKLATGS